MLPNVQDCPRLERVGNDPVIIVTQEEAELAGKDSGKKARHGF